MSCDVRESHVLGFMAGYWRGFVTYMTTDLPDSDFERVCKKLDDISAKLDKLDDLPKRIAEAVADELEERATRQKTASCSL